MIVKRLEHLPQYLAPQPLPGVICECRARTKLWELVVVAPKQNNKIILKVMHKKKSWNTLQISLSCIYKNQCYDFYSTLVCHKVIDNLLRMLVPISSNKYLDLKSYLWQKWNKNKKTSLKMGERKEEKGNWWHWWQVVYSGKSMGVGTLYWIKPQLKIVFNKLKTRELPQGWPHYKTNNLITYIVSLFPSPSF